MAETYRGLTIRIGGDSSSLQKALKNTNASISQTQAELKKANASLRLDPTSIAAYNLQLGFMGDKASETATKLAVIRDAANQLSDTMVSLSDGTRATFSELVNGPLDISEKMASTQDALASVTKTLAGMHDNLTDMTAAMGRIELDKIKEAMTLSFSNEDDQAVERFSKSIAEIGKNAGYSDEQIETMKDKVHDLGDEIRGIMLGDESTGQKAMALYELFSETLPEGVSISATSVGNMFKKLEGNIESLKKKFAEVASLQAAGMEQASTASTELAESQTELIDKLEKAVSKYKELSGMEIAKKEFNLKTDDVIDDVKDLEADIKSLYDKIGEYSRAGSDEMVSSSRSASERIKAQDNELLGKLVAMQKSAISQANADYEAGIITRSTMSSRVRKANDLLLTGGVGEDGSKVKGQYDKAIEYYREYQEELARLEEQYSAKVASGIDDDAMKAKIESLKSNLSQLKEYVDNVEEMMSGRRGRDALTKKISSEMQGLINGVKTMRVEREREAVVAQQVADIEDEIAEKQAKVDAILEGQDGKYKKIVDLIERIRDGSVTSFNVDELETLQELVENSYLYGSEFKNELGEALEVAVGLANEARLTQERLAQSSEEAEEMSEALGAAASSILSKGLETTKFTFDNGNTDLKTIGTVLEYICELMGLNVSEAEEFLDSIKRLDDAHAELDKDARQLRDALSFQDLVAEAELARATIANLSEQMKNMHAPSDLVQGMGVLNQVIRELDDAVKTTSGSLSTMRDVSFGDPDSLEYMDRLFAKLRESQLLAGESIESLQKKYDAFDVDRIEEFADQGKSATMQLVDATEAAARASTEYKVWSGEVEMLERRQEELKNQIEQVESELDKEGQYTGDKEWLERIVSLNSELEVTEKKLATAREERERFRQASTEADEAQQYAKQRVELERVSDELAVARAHQDELNDSIGDMADEYARAMTADFSSDVTSRLQGDLDGSKKVMDALTERFRVVNEAAKKLPENMELSELRTQALNDVISATEGHIENLGIAMSDVMSEDDLERMRQTYGDSATAVQRTETALSVLFRRIAEGNGDLDQLRESLVEAKNENAAAAMWQAWEKYSQELLKAKTSLASFQEQAKGADFEPAEIFKSATDEVNALKKAFEGDLFAQFDSSFAMLTERMESARAKIRDIDEQLKSGSDDSLLADRLVLVEEAAEAADERARLLRDTMESLGAEDSILDLVERFGTVSNAVTRLSEEATATKSSIQAIYNWAGKFASDNDLGDGWVDSFKNVREEMEGLPDEARQMRARLSELLDDDLEISVDLTTAVAVEHLRKLEEKGRETGDRIRGSLRNSTKVALDDTASKELKKLSDDLKDSFESTGVDTLLKDLSYLSASVAENKAQFESLKGLLKNDFGNEVLKGETIKSAETYIANLRAEIESARAALKAWDDSSIDSTVLKAGNAKGAFEKAKDEFEAARAKVKSLEAEIREAEQAIVDMDGSADMSEARAKVDSLKESLKSAKEEAENAGKQFEVMRNTLKYSEVESGMSKMIADEKAAVKELDEKFKGLGRTTSDSGAAFQQAVQEVGQAAERAGQKIIESANTIDSAYRNIRKTVQGTEEQYKSLHDAAVEFSQSSAITADAMLEMEALGGQLGITVDALQEFGETASNLDIATNISAEDIAIQLGQITNIMDDLDFSTFDNFADALVRLGNNTATTESRIMEVAQRMSAVANVTSMTTPQLLGWSAAIASTGQRSESAATAISNSITGIGKAVAEGGATLEQFAHIAGMSADEFKEKWETSSSEALEAFVKGLGNLSETSTDAIAALESVGISSVRQTTALLALSQTVDNLDDSIEMSKNAFNGVSDQWGKAGDAAREAQNKSEGFSGSLQILKNNAAVLAESLGDSMVVPMQLLSGLLGVVKSAIDAIPGPLRGVVVGLGAAAAAIGVTVPVLEQFVKGWKELAQNAKSGTEGMNLVKAAFVTLKQSIGLATDANVKSVAASKAATTATSEQATANATLAGTSSAVASGNAMEATSAEEAAAAMETKGVATNEIVAANEMEVASSAEVVTGNAAESASSGTLSAELTQQAVAEGSAASGNQTLAVSSDVATAALGRQAIAATAASIGIKALKLALGGVAFFVLSQAISGVLEALGALAGAISDSIERQKKLDEVAEESARTATALGDAYETAYGKIKDAPSLEELKEETDEIIDSFERFDETVNTALDDLGTSEGKVDAYAESIKELGNQGSISEADLVELRNAVKQYNDITGASISIIDEQTGKLNLNTVAIDEVTAAYKRQAEVKAYAELYNKTVEERISLTQEQKEAEEELKEVNKEYADGVMDITKAWENAGKKKDLEERLEVLRDRIDTLIDREQAYKNGMTETEKQMLSFEAAMVSAGQTTEDFSGLTDSEKEKLAEVQSALMESGDSIGNYGDMNVEQMKRIAAAWTGSVPSIINALRNIKNAADEAASTVAEATKITDDQYNEIKNDYDQLYTEQKRLRDDYYDSEREAREDAYEDYERDLEDKYTRFEQELDNEYNAQKKYYDQVYTAQKEAYDDEYDALKDSLDKQYDAQKDMYDKMYDARKDELDKEYDARKDELDKEYDALKDQLDKEYDAYKDYLDDVYDARKDELDDEYDAYKDYLDDIYDARKKELDDEYDAIKDQLDDVYDARKKELDDEYDAAKKASSSYLKQYKKDLEAQTTAFKSSTDERVKAMEAERDAQKDIVDADLKRKTDDIDARIKALKALTAAEEEAADARDRAEKTSDLQKAVTKAKSNRKRAEAEKALNDYLEELRLKDAKAERERQIEALEDQKSALKEQADARKEALTDQYKSEVEQYKEMRSQQLDVLDESLDEEYERMKEAEDERLELMKERQSNDLEALKEQQESYLESIKETQDAELESLKDAHDSQLESMKDSHEAELEALKDEHDAQLEMMKDDQESQLETLKDSNDAELEMLKDNHDTMLEQMKDSQETSLEMMKDAQDAQLEARKREQEHSLEALKDQQEQRLQELKNTHDGQLTAMKRENEDLLESMKETQDAELLGLKRAHEDELTRIKNDYDETLRHLKDGSVTYEEIRDEILGKHDQTHEELNSKTEQRMEELAEIVDEGAGRVKGIVNETLTGMGSEAEAEHAYMLQSQRAARDESVSIAEEGKEGIEQTQQDLVGSAQQFISDFATAIVGGARTTKDETSQVADEAVSEAGQKSGEIKKSFEDGGIKEIKDVAKTAVDDGSDAIGQSTMPDTAKAEAEEVSSSFDESLDLSPKVDAKLREADDELKTGFGTMKDTTKTGAESQNQEFEDNVDIKGKVDEEMKEVDSRTESGLDDAKDTVGSGAESMVDEFGTKFELADEARDAVEDMESEIKRELSHLEDEVEVLGGNVAVGFANGINRYAHKAIDAAQDMANAVNNIISSVSKIKSPSRVTMKFGEYVAKGFAIGISRGAEESVLAAESMGMQTLAGLEDVLGINSPSKRFAEAGEYVDEGLALGIDRKSYLATNALSDMALGMMGSYEDEMSGMSDITDDGVAAMDVSDMASRYGRDAGTMFMDSLDDAIFSREEQMYDHLKEMADNMQEVVSRGFDPSWALASAKEAVNEIHSALARERASAFNSALGGFGQIQQGKGDITINVTLSDVTIRETADIDLLARQLARRVDQAQRARLGR